MSIADLSRTLADRNLDFLAGAPSVLHCHHFNLFLDQTIDDALGPVDGPRLRFEAARDAARQLLRGAIGLADLRTPAERLAFAQELFGAMGHGILHLDATPNGGTAEGHHLHYGFAWREKYGSIVRRRTPADAVASGFAAAAVELAFDTVPMDSTEQQCIAMEHDRCSFTLSPDPSATTRPLLTEDNIDCNPPTRGLEEDRIAHITAELRGLLATVKCDDRGLVQAFGVYVTRHLTNYYNAISYASVERVASRNMALVPMVEGLLRESGHVCVFNTFGGILYSPEWDGLVGRVRGDLEEVVGGCCAIARALGFGSWAISELTPERLVLRTGSEYESPFCQAALGNQCRGTSYFLQGAALAFMRLWQAIDWNSRPGLDQRLYDQLFRSGQVTWHVEQTRTLSAGDPVSEVVVTRR